MRRQLVRAAETTRTMVKGQLAAKNRYNTRKDLCKFFFVDLFSLVEYEDFIPPSPSLSPFPPSLLLPLKKGAKPLEKNERF